MRKYGKTTGKDMDGLYLLHGRRTWKIIFPYMTEHFLFVGSKADAEKAAEAIILSTKWMYSPKIKEIEL